MMLTARPTTPNPSVFAHNHTPSVAASSSPSQPASPGTRQSQAPPSSVHMLRGGMDSNAASSGSATGHVNEQGRPPPPLPPPAQLIPMTAMHQPFIVGAGGTGYTLFPSIQQLGSLSAAGNDGTPMLGIQPLGTMSSLQRPGGTTMQPLTALPSGYYGRVQSETPPTPMGIQHPIRQLTAASLSSPPTQLSGGRDSTPPTSTPRLPPPHHPHTLLVSGTRNGVIMNGNQTPNNLESKHNLSVINPEPIMISREQASILSSPPSSSPSSQLRPDGSQLHPDGSLDKNTSSSDPDICRRTSLEGLSDAEARGRRRQSHDAHLSNSYSRSRASRHVSHSNVDALSSPSSSEARLPTDILVKQEPLGEEGSSIPHHQTARRNSDSNLEETMTTTGASSKSYQISALIDIPPMAPPLNRASRTSSLSSSLSSFRFGGSLSQLWASQISLSGKINNMKSTG